MRLSIGSAQIAEYLARQLSNMFPDRQLSAADCARAVDHALQRLDHCFLQVKDKYLPEGAEPYFNHRHTDHYAMFLYLVANSAFREEGGCELAEKAYALNKALHGIDAYYEVALPEVFFFQHPIGTVLGRATYSNYFIVYQRCTVGGKDRRYPVIGEGVIMYGGSAIIGECTVGRNVWFSTGARVLRQNVPDDSAVFSQSPNLVVKPTKRNVFESFFQRRGR
jgi:serine O-acetyltransferase